MRCNAGAMLLVLGLPLFAWGQPAASADPPQPNEHAATDTLKFLAGGGAALAVHESGHLVFDGLFGAGVRVTSVHFGPVPFFAVSHRAGLPPREEVTISSAGFWTQEATAEWLLATHPDLRREHAPFAKAFWRSMS